MKVIRAILVVLSSLFLVLFTLSALILIQPNWFKKPINRLVAEVSGFDLTFERLSTTLQPGQLNAAGLNLAYQGETLLTAKQVTLTVSDWPSLSSPFFTLNLKAPAFYYTLDDNGRSNWPQSQSPEPPPSEPKPLLLPKDFAFYALVIENGEAKIRLPGQNRDIQVSNLNLERIAPERARLTLQTTIDQQTFNVNGEFALESEHQLAFDLGLNHPQLETLLQATLSTRPAFDGSRGKLKLSLENTSFLEALLGIKIPQLPKTTLQADFAIGEHYQLDNVVLQLGEQRLNGAATYSPVEKHLTARLNSPALDIDAIQALFQDSEAVATGAEEVEQAVTEPTSNKEAAIDWSALSELALDLELKVASLKAQGLNAETLESHIVLRNDGDTPKIALALSSGPMRFEQRQLDALSVNAELHPLSLQTEGADADITLSAKLNNTISLNTKGKANLNGLSGQALQLNIDSANSAELWKIAGLPYREAGALAIKGTFDSDGNTVTPDLAIALGEQQIDIEASYTDGKRPRLNLIANGRNLDTRFMEADTDDEKPPQTEKAADKNAPLFSRDPIDTALLQNMDADISLDIKKLRTGVNQIDEIAIIAQLKDGRLTTRNSRVALPDSSLDISLDGRFTEQTSKIRTEFLLDSKNIGGLGLEKAAQIRNGRGKVDVKLSTEGRSPHELAGALNGSIDIKAQDMIMDNNKVNLIGSDIFSELFDKLNPFAKSDPTTQLECVALYFDVDNGLMIGDRTLHVETSKMKIIGKGEINLGKERLSMNFTPIARKGLGVNFSQVVKLVKLYGPIQSPRIGVDAGGLLTSALSTSAAMATGGASLIAQNLLERAANSGSACDPNKKLELELPEPVAEEVDTEGEPAAAQQPGN